MKKLLIFALVAVLLVPSLAACSVNTNNEQPPNSSAPVASEQPVPTSSFQAPVKPEDLPIPADDSCILDYANILGDGYSEEAEILIFPWIEYIENKCLSAGGVFKRLVIVTSSSLGGIDASEYAERLLNYWGSGSSWEGCGMLLLLAPEEKKFAFVFGSEIRNYLTGLSNTESIDAFIETLFSTVTRVEMAKNNSDSHGVFIPRTPFQRNEYTFFDCFNRGEYIDAVGSFVDNLWLFLGTNPSRVEPKVYEFFGDTCEFDGCEWLMLDVQDDKALLLSKYVIDLRPYDDHDLNSGGLYATWEECSLRHWLNGDFFMSFDAAEQERVLDTYVINDDSVLFQYPQSEGEAGNNTTDKVFLLSVDEVVRYFGDSGEFADLRSVINDEYNDARAAVLGIPQEKIRDLAQRLYDSSESDYSKYWSLETLTGDFLYGEFEGSTCSWWLRTPSYNGFSQPAYVLGEIGFGEGIGQISLSGRYCNYLIGVRPAMWISLK